MDYNNFNNDYNQYKQGTMFSGYPVEISKYGGKPIYQSSGPTSIKSLTNVTIPANKFIDYLNTLGPVKRRRTEKLFTKAITSGTSNTSNNNDTSICANLTGVDKIRCEAYVKNMEESEKYIEKTDKKYEKAIKVAAISKGLAGTASMLASLFAKRNLPNPILQETNPKLQEVVRNLKTERENTVNRSWAQTHGAYDTILKSGLTNPLTAILATHVNSINGLNKLLPTYDSAIANANAKLGENEANVANTNANTVNAYKKDARDQILQRLLDTLKYGNDLAAIPSEIFDELYKKDAAVTIPLKTIARAYPYAPISNYGGKKLHRRKKC